VLWRRIFGTKRGKCVNKTSERRASEIALLTKHYFTNQTEENMMAGRRANSGNKFYLVNLNRACPDGRAVWDCEFESRRGHGCLSLVSVVCCQVEVSATG
jgi:hypothetical protein